MTVPSNFAAYEYASARLEGLLGEPVSHLQQLHHGVGGIVLSGIAASQRRVVVKVSLASELDLRVEARMLQLLKRAALPVPEILATESRLLVLEYVETDADRGTRFEEDAADALARLHATHSSNSMYGLDESSYVGCILQDNRWSQSWVDFFRERRLLPALRHCANLGRLPATMMDRVERVVERLGSLLPDTPAASLIHGDVWEGNVLARSGRLIAFVDPSPSFSHAEIELAFITLFETFSDAFFARYAVTHPMAHEFWSERRHVYNLYPLLVHVALFPGEYIGKLDSTLRRIGFGPP